MLDVGRKFGWTGIWMPCRNFSIRREVFASRVIERGGTVSEDVVRPSGEMVSHVIVDDHISLSLICRALLQVVSDALHPGKRKIKSTDETAVSESKKRILGALENNNTFIMRAGWLSACLRERLFLDPLSESQNNHRLNVFVQSHLIANVAGVEKASSVENKSLDESVRSHSVKKQPVTKRDETPDRQFSYHSDDDHKSRASSISDLSITEDEAGDDASGSNQASDDEGVTPTGNSAAKVPVSPQNVAAVENEDSKASKLLKSNIFLSPTSGKVLAVENQKLVEQLEEMMKMYRNLGDKFRGYAYARAISAIRRYPKPIVDAQQLKDLKNVGPRIASHIMEFLDTGRVGKNEQLVHNDDINVVINLFVNIHGVGTKTAQRWAQMGYRTLDDVREKASLTTEQKIGLQYYDEFLKKMPREEVEEIFHVVKIVTDSIEKGFIFEVCGSYRRGRDLCGDVDILMTHPDGHSHETILKPLLDKLHQKGFLTDDLSISDGHHKRYFGVCRLDRKEAKHRRLDIIISPYNEWATCVFGWTGSMYFVRSMRDYAHKKDMSLTDYALHKNVIRQDGEKVNEGEKIETPTEESIFDALGLPYLSPEERDH
ncbi:DNA polymerase lambda-like isoform X2 [Paramacrobiotus metropolitanus]|uniref:DNA polymerase lambda-like isoform X2 n=1 Tax=Paramacrobiotus metropolitanus TaxID=2943436 RepID=UPI0024463980|nr:DNA polymerase lambda-like isoform X2 [Paramacrobiotus metropolitanus]